MSRTEMTDEEQFISSCSAAANFPKNLVYPNTYEHLLKVYAERLSEQEKRLFLAETKADVELWECKDQCTGTSKLAFFCLRNC
jgi:hypothetical protein